MMSRSFKVNGHLEGTCVLWRVGKVHRFFDVFHAEDVTEERGHIDLLFSNEPQCFSKRRSTRLDL